jgi:hypothetical protein
MGEVENTSKRPAGLHLGGMLAQGVPGYVEGMEARGQRELVHSDQIPVDGPVDELEALGFKLGDVVEDDPIWRTCTLPEGWQRTRASDTAYWSYICDETGTQRIAIFYKAAFYDRSASFYIRSEEAN